MELTSQILKNVTLKRVTHAEAQKLRRRAIKCSQSMSAFGDMMLDFDLQQLDGESLVYIMLLMLRRNEVRQAGYFVNTSIDKSLQSRYLDAFVSINPKSDWTQKTDKQIAALCGILN